MLFAPSAMLTGESNKFPLLRIRDGFCREKNQNQPCNKKFTGPSQLSNGAACSHKTAIKLGYGKFEKRLVRIGLTQIPGLKNPKKIVPTSLFAGYLMSILLTILLM